MASCADDDNGDAVTKHYDGDNANAPALTAGVWEFGVRLPEDLLVDVHDLSLSGVEVFIYNIPQELTLRVYEDNAGDFGRQVHSQTVTGLSVNSWNTINLTTPVENNGDGLWMALEVNHGSDIQVVGCDAGPANPNGDWLYDGADELYRRFIDRTGTDVNWNMRAIFR